MSTFIRPHAIQPAPSSEAISTRTVTGRRRANSMGFMRSLVGLRISSVEGAPSRRSRDRGAAHEVSGYGSPVRLLRARLLVTNVVLDVHHIPNSSPLAR